jgi:hypothetical protein
VPEAKVLRVRFIARTLTAAFLFIALTLVTQVGGIAYLAAKMIARRDPALGGRDTWRYKMKVGSAGLAIYALLTWIVVPPIAAKFGRVRLPCGADGKLMPASWLTCALNRGFVTPGTSDLVMALAEAMSRQFPGSPVTTLEGGFPFIDGFPVLPHLSYRDGRKVDVAFFYRRTDIDEPIPWGSPSPVGYFVYGPLPGEPAPCIGRWTPLRWDFSWFQPAAPVWRIDEIRTAAMIAWLKEQPRVARLFIEPYLAERLSAAGGKVRFQGCKAARHDDHIHIESQSDR